MYNNIVVAFDGSEYSKAALAVAAGRVKRHGGKITLVHAVYFDEEEFGIAPVQIEKRMEFGQKACYQAKEKYTAEPGVDIDSLICQGEPPDVIADIARERKADLIAMGTHGRRGLKRLIMGSVTSHVISISHTDVLVVKRPCRECTGDYKSILVAYDGSEYSGMALNRAGELAKAEGGEVTVLYVIPRYEEMVGFFKTDSIKKSLIDEAEKVLSSAQGVASKNGFQIATVVQEGHSAEKITQMADRLGSDLIVMGTFGWTGVDKAIMGSTTERVIVNASCPVLVVR